MYSFRPCGVLLRRDKQTETRWFSFFSVKSLTTIRTTIANRCFPSNEIRTYWKIDGKQDRFECANKINVNRTSKCIWSPNAAPLYRCEWNLSSGFSKNYVCIRYKQFKLFTQSKIDWKIRNTERGWHFSFSLSARVHINLCKYPSIILFGRQFNEYLAGTMLTCSNNRWRIFYW